MATEIKTDSEVRDGERIAKVMARAGLCSRRDAEEWIAAGRVSVNGEALTSPAYNVSPDDAVMVDGKPLNERQRTRLFMYHKPKGLITSAKDPEGRETVFDNLPPGLPRVVSIGRLDINTEGLLLLTNDGGLARVLELPETGWLRRYRVRAHGEVNQAQLDALKDGISLEGVNYAGIEARLERTVGSNVWLTMGLREGKNREIKRVLEHLGLLVNRLIRISFGPFELAELPEGEVDEIPTRVLRDQLGVKLANRAGADFDSPVYDPAPAAPEPAAIVARPPRREAPPERRGKSAEGPPSEPRRAGGTTEPRKRKHVSILRAEARAEAETDRKRVVRSATSDRKGREIKVEHFSQAKPARAEKPAGRDAAAPRGRPSGGDKARDAAPRPRNYANASARDGAPKFRKPREDSSRDGAPRTRAFGDGPKREGAPRSKSYGDGAPRDGAAKFRKPRDESPRDGAPRARSFGDAAKREGPPRSKSYGDGPPRDGAAKFRKPRDESPRDGAPRARSFGDAAKREGPPRSKSYGDGAPRDGAAKFRKPRDESPRDGAPRAHSFGDAAKREGAPRSKSYGDGPPRDGAPRSRPARDGAPRGGGFKPGGGAGRPAGKGGSSGPRGASGGGAKRPPRRPS
jgi:23S rRNA pseudouridine2605 synthase